MPTQRLAQFSLDIGRARDLVGLGQSVANMTYGRVDASDLYRSGLVQAVAALDRYVHGVVLDRAVDMLMGRLQATASSTKVGLHFGAVQALLNAGSSVHVELTARSQVAQRLSLETFQRADDVAKALSMVGVTKIWSTAFAPNSNPTTTALGLIVDRRNRIVHACDMDPLNPGAVTPLSDQDSLDAITTVESIVTTIDPYC